MSEVEIKKSLLILVSKPGSTSGAEAFLRNREWLVHSTSNLKEFLIYIIQKKPSFVMISVDHSHKKIRVMPTIILQTFSACVITFAENSTSVSFRKLQDINCEYRVNPPATGPAIERAVNKYLKDLEKKQRGENVKDSAETGAEGSSSFDTVEIKGEKYSGVTKIEGSQNASGGNQNFTGDAGGFSSSLLSQLMGGDDDGDGFEGSAQDASGAFITKSGDSSGSGFWAPDDSYSDKNPNQRDPNNVTYNEDDFTGGFLSGNNGTSSYQEGSDGHSGAAIGGSIKSPQTPGFDNQEPGALGSNSAGGSLSQNKKNNSDPGAFAGAGENSFSGKLEKQKRIDPKLKVITQKGRNVNDLAESIILKGTKHALTESVQVNDGVIEQEIEDSSHVACIIVESDRFSGYLIAAMGKNRKMDGSFIKCIQEKLFKFLNENGESVSEKDNLQLKIKKVEFQDWALEYADFLKKSVHNGEEVAMAFFPVNNVKPEVGDSASATMASVKLSDIEADKAVDFNVYVYLPANKKYILYTPKGSKFYGNQKSRLETRGVKEVHMLKSEVNDLTKYKAQNYLNNLIDSYEMKKKVAEAV
ncbi:MAG: hypothetical protein KDD45_01510 [Bdellovibrionales bacterium]|nr:hypothetical protein [Bdellovibrionales bacterium]